MRSGMTCSVAAVLAALLGGGCGGPIDGDAEEPLIDGATGLQADAGSNRDSGEQPDPDAGTADGGGSSHPDAGASDAGNEDGGGSSPDAGASDAGTTPGAQCLATPLLEHFGAPSRLLVGGDFEDALVPSARFDLRYHYLAGGISAGEEVCTSCEAACASVPGKTWWGCWQDVTRPPGEYLRRFLSKAADFGHLPLITYYQQLDASGASEGAGQVAAMADAALMHRYFADFRFMLQTIGSSYALVHVEPDLWGYLQRASPDPEKLEVAVQSANPEDCAGLPNDATGFGRCLVTMARQYAPNVRIGLHASGWATGADALYNREPSFDVTADAEEVARYLAAVAPDADFVGVDPSDRDAGYYQSVGKQKWWDASDATLPNFRQAFEWTRALTTALGKPALWWQLPLGNERLEDTQNRWRDNRVDTLFARADELAASNTFAMAFGAGRSDQTLPATDDGNFAAKVRAYVDGGGVPACR